MKKERTTPKSSPKNEQAKYGKVTQVKCFYHYTTGQKLVQILESGHLLPSSKGGKSNERPLLWLSTATDIEPTSLKMVRGLDGALFRLSRDQQRRIAGNVRFVLKQKLPLMGWNEACKAAGITNKERRAMELHGKAMGGNPSCWFASLNALSIDLFDIEVDTGARWVPIQDAMMQEVVK